MFQNVALSVIFVVFVAATEPPKGALPGMTEVPSCKALLDLGDHAYKLPNCNDEVDACFKEAHSLAPKCYAKEVKLFKECYAKQEVKDLIKNWFSDACNMHLAMISCMKNEEASEKFETETDITDNQHNETMHKVMKWLGKYSEKYPEVGECWGEVFKKMDDCKAKAQQQCGNFGICFGSKNPAHDASDVLKTWYKIGRTYEKKRYNGLKEFMKIFTDCTGTKLDEEGAK